MSAEEPRARESSTEPVPHQPTRESAAASTDPEQVKERGTKPAETPVSEELAEGRQEIGGEADSRKHPPHVTSGEADAPLQDEHPSPEDVPVLPANAAGIDKAAADEQAEPIDDESMYDRRPERDKDRPPSERGE